MKDAKKVGQEIENLDDNNNNKRLGPLHCEVLHTQMEKWDEESSLMSSTDRISPERSFPVRNSIPLPSSCTVILLNYEVFVSKNRLVEIGF